MPQINNTVVGTDGSVPVYEPSGRWCWWSIKELYFGGIAENMFVPKKNDYVLDPETFTTFIVDDIDVVTLIPTLREIRPANMSFSLSQTDVLFGVGPGTQADTYRAYLNTTTMPHTLAVDARLKIAGTMCSYVKIFKGAIIDQGGHVISKMFDGSNNFVSENVPLELAALDTFTNHSIKIVPTCYCTEEIDDGEIVTVVAYSDSGHVVSKRQLLIENTSFIRGMNTAQKYITHISLTSPFLSPMADKTIDYPLNVPLNALNLMGTVHYSTGETLTLPVDGTKFRMFGLEQYTSSIVGQKLDLVLSYALADNETSYAGIGSNGNHINEPYNLMTVNPNNSYTVKLFGYPFWRDSANGYQMRFWMLNLDRNVFFEVTNFVNFSENTGAFDPKGYGYMQRKSVNINLRDVSGVFKPFVHTQTIEVVLNGEPQTDSTSWTVSHESNSGRLMYGHEIFAKKKAVKTINLKSDILEFEEWRDRVYKSTYPLVNPNTEVTPLVPTHFLLTYEGATTEYSINSWASDIVLAADIVVTKTVAIRFIKRTASGDLQLAVSAMIIRA